MRFQRWNRKIDNQSEHAGTVMTLDLNNKNVGIGTGAKVVSGDYKLVVAGKVNVREVNVDITAGADFVFADDYDLLSLKETETFVKEYKHLPGIPSKAEMIEKGLDLGAMNIRLL